MRPAIRVDGLSKRYRVGRKRPDRNMTEHLWDGLRTAWGKVRQLANPDAGSADTDEFWALKDVSFEVQPAEVVGIIGRNGAGKSTLLKVLSRIVEPTGGTAEIDGRVGSLLEVGTGFHPELTGRENVYLNGTILGMGRKEIDRKFDAIVDFAGVEKFLDTPVKRYSSGMMVRLGFAVAAHLEPEVLIVDEVLAVGDADFQAKCMRRMDGVAREGKTVIVVSHNAATVRQLCTKALRMAGGRVVGYGPVDEQVSEYLHQFLTEAKAPVSDRTDREGTGAARVTGLTVRDQNDRETSVLHVGEPWAVAIDYTAQSSPKRLTAALSVWTADGTKLCHVDNDIHETDLGPVRAGGRVRCQFPRLSLTAGRYYCNVLLAAGGETADHVYRAVEFEVHDGDYYRTGRLTPGGGAAIYLDHEWSLG
jgi:lipopolysaccharide transport system ATP-binding protein